MSLWVLLGMAVSSISLGGYVSSTPTHPPPYRVRIPLNGIFADELLDLTVTGFRDHSVAPWPAMDSACGKPGIYAVLSGSVPDGPRSFLFTVHLGSVRSTFESVLAPGIAHNFCPNEKWYC